MVSYVRELGDFQTIRIFAYFPCITFGETRMKGVGWFTLKFTDLFKVWRK